MGKIRENNNRMPNDMTLKKYYRNSFTQDFSDANATWENSIGGKLTFGIPLRELQVIWKSPHASQERRTVLVDAYHD